MGRNNDRPPNRFITIITDSITKLDRRGQELADIIDAYGGTNPYPRLVSREDGELIYSFTTKIPTLNIEEFDKEVAVWRSK